MGKEKNERKKSSASLKPGNWSFSLKTFLLSVLIPVVILIAGTIVLSVRINDEVKSYTMQLEQETVNNILLAQSNSSNLQSLSVSLSNIVYSSSPDRARRAFVNAWGLLTESSFDRHRNTKTSTERLLTSLKETWQLRKQYDEGLHKINDTFRSLYFHLLLASGLAAGVTPTTVDLLQMPLHRSVLYLDDTDIHKQHLNELKAAFSGLCSNRHIPNEKERASIFAEHCRAIQELPKILYTALDELADIKNNFFAHIQVMNADALKLRQEYSVIETSDLLESIGLNSNFYKRILSVFFASLLIAIAVTLLLGVSFYFLMYPLIELTGQMRQFLANNQMPKLRSASHIREINDVISWMMRFCELIRETKEKETQLTAEYGKLLESSYFDQLTNLHNRKALEDFIDANEELPSHTCVLMLDLDHFKDLNDRAGHLFGDQILSVFGRHLKLCVTRKDQIYRYGGEEFCIVLSDVTPRSARESAERICRKVRQISSTDASVSLDGKPAADPLTVSIGISSVSSYTGYVNIVTLIREADIALYRAKKTGRDRVCSFDSDFADDVSSSQGNKEQTS